MNQPFNPDDAFKAIANGVLEAYDFCWAFFNWVQMIDDAVDRDKPVDAHLTVCSMFTLLECVSTNTFYQKNWPALLPVIRASAMAYLDSEELRKSEAVQDKVTAELLKSQYQDVFFQVAFLTGGWGHMAAMTKRFRGYHFG